MSKRNYRTRNDNDIDEPFKVEDIINILPRAEDLTMWPELLSSKLNYYIKVNDMHIGRVLLEYIVDALSNHNDGNKYQITHFLKNDELRVESSNFLYSDIIIQIPFNDVMDKFPFKIKNLISCLPDDKQCWFLLKMKEVNPNGV